MNYDFNKPVRDLDGKPVVVETPIPTNELKDNGPKVTTKELTFKTCVVNSLLNTHPDKDKGMQGEEKAKLYCLATSIYRAEAEAELTAEDVTLIKSRLAMFQSVMVYGQIVEFLEDNSKE